MAKENKKAAEAAQANEENIIDQIKSENKMEDSIVKAAEEQIKEEKDKAKKDQMKQAILMAEYINRRELLNLRKEREIGKITKVALTGCTENLNKLKKGELTPREYEKAMCDIATERRKKLNELDNEYRDLYEELKGNFPNYYDAEWDYMRWTDSKVRSRFGW